MAIKKRNIGGDQIDGSKLLLRNDDPLRALNASGQSVSLFKVDANSLLKFLVVPRVSVNPDHDDELARRGYVDAKVVDSLEGSQTTAAPSVAAVKAALDNRISQIQLYKHQITEQDVSAGYMEIPSVAISTGVMILTNSGVSLLQDVHYTIAVSPSDATKSRITFIGEMAAGGVSAIDTNDIFHVYYFPVTDGVVVSGGGDVTKAYVDAADASLSQQVVSSIASEASRAQAAEASLSSAISSGVQEAKTYADSAVAGIVNAAPAALNTLNELAAALGNDSSFSVSVTNSLAGKASTSLNNLANTAVNVDILPETNNTRKLGSSSFRFSEVHSNKFEGSAGGIAVQTIPSLGAPNYTFGLYGSTYPISIFSWPNTTNNSASKAVYIESGYATGTTSNSGLINIQTGTATSNSGDIFLTTGTATGTRGKIVLSANQIDLSSSIVPTAAVTYSLGTSALPFNAGFFRGLNFSPYGTVTASNGKTYTTSQVPAQIVGSDSAPPDALPSPVIKSFSDFAIETETISTGATKSNKIRLLSGNTVDGDSGEILIRTGVPSGTGTRGKVSIQANTVDVNSTTIVNVATPVNATDAANRAYVDAQPLVGLNLYVELPTSTTYVLCEYPFRAFTIQELRIRTQAGSASVTVQVNNVSVTGMTNLTATTTQSSATATAGNVVAVGQRVTLVVNTTTGCTGLAVTVRIS